MSYFSECDVVYFSTGGSGSRHTSRIMFCAVKIVDLNPSVPEDQIYDLLCEKFSDFSDFTINFAQQDKNRVAYLNFKNADDARAAQKENSCIVLFGHACRALPVYGAQASAATENTSSRDYFADDDPDFMSQSFRKSEADDEQVGLEPDEHGKSPPRSARRGGFQYRGVGRWHRGNRGSRARPTRGKPYLLTPARGRSKQKPYLLTKPRDNGEHDLPASRGNDAESTTAVASATSDEKLQKEANSVLFVGSLDPTVQVIDLQRLFKNFGFVLFAEIKNTNAANCFAFVHFLTMDMAVLAKQEMQGKTIGHTVPRLGFGRVVESKCLWVGGVGPWTTEDMLRMEFGQFGEIARVEWPKNRDYAYVMFSNVQDAMDARQVMNGSLHGDPPHPLRICYATPAQMTSHINYKEFPKFPKRPLTERAFKPKKKFVPQLTKTRPTEKHRSHDRESPKRRSRDRESPESRRRRRRSLERSRSRSRPRKSRSSHGRARKRERTPPSPYARGISHASSMSAISETSSESVGSLERKRQRKSRRRSSVSRSPVTKPLRNPSPPPKSSVMKDERTVVLRSEPQPVPKVSIPPSDAFTSALNQMHAAASMPSYVTPVDPNVVYYPPPVASTLPPTIYPPPVHIPPPDYYMQSNPMMVQYPQHLPPLSSYPPPIATADTTQPPPALSQVSIPPPVQTSKYVPASKPAEKSQPDAAAAKESKKPTSVAAQFPKVWSGALVLRNAAFVVDFHLLSGSVLLVNKLLGSNVEPGAEADCPVLKIAQRLRLDQPDKLDELDRRLRKAGRTGCSVLLATSTPAQVDDDANVVQQYPLGSLVSYLLQKQVAAVVSLPPGSSDAAKATGVLHAFPPCPFATRFLNREAPGLPSNCPTEEELLVVICEV